MAWFKPKRRDDPQPQAALPAASETPTDAVAIDVSFDSDDALARAVAHDQAALAEPLGVGMHAVDQANVRPGDRVAILGAGAIGLSAAVTLLDRGIEDVCVVDLSAARLEVAKKLGVPHVVESRTADLWEALGELHGRQSFYGSPLVGTNVFIEATGSGALLEQVVARCAPATRVSVVALHRKPVSIDFMTVLMKQMTLVGAMEYPERYEQMLELIERHL